MNGSQMAGAIALAVIGFLMIVVSATARDDVRMTSFGDKLSKAGIMVGGLFMLPLVLLLAIGVVIGFQ